MIDHVHGEHTITTESGRVFCSCGYEKGESTADDGSRRVFWGIMGSDGPDLEGTEMRRLLWAKGRDA